MMNLNFGDGEGVKKRERTWEKNDGKIVRGVKLVSMVFLVWLVSSQNCEKWHVYIGFANEWALLHWDPSKRFINSWELI